MSSALTRMTLLLPRSRASFSSLLGVQVYDGKWASLSALHTVLSNYQSGQNRCFAAKQTKQKTNRKCNRALGKARGPLETSCFTAVNDYSTALDCLLPVVPVKPFVFGWLAAGQSPFATWEWVGLQYLTVEFYSVRRVQARWDTYLVIDQKQ